MKKLITKTEIETYKLLYILRCSENYVKNANERTANDDKIVKEFNENILERIHELKHFLMDVGEETTWIYNKDFKF